MVGVRERRGGMGISGRGNSLSKSMVVREAVEMWECGLVMGEVAPAGQAVTGR